MKTVVPITSKAFIILITCLICSTSCEESAAPLPSEEKVTRAMNAAMEKSDLPALVAIAINKAGEKVTYSYGKAVWEEDAEVTPNHIFRIYSMTKLVTSIAALQLVEKGILGLDDDLSELMPEMTSIPILLNGELVEPENTITLRHLLTHTSGFGYLGFTISNEGFNGDTWEYEDMPRHFESGTKFLYGSSTDWVGKLVEKVSGIDLEAYFRKYITGPLQMNRTYFNVPDSLQSYIVSYGHRGDDGEQELTKLPNRIPATKDTILSGGGGLFSSPSDYTKLLQCLLNDGAYEGGSILNKATIEEMNENQVGAINLNPEGRHFDPAACCNFNDLMDENSKWGLAYMIDTTPKTYGRQEGTVLWGGLFNTYYYIDFKSGIAVSMYSQHIPFNHLQTTSLLEQFSELVYNSK